MSTQDDILYLLEREFGIKLEVPPRPGEWIDRLIVYDPKKLVEHLHEEGAPYWSLLQEYRPSVRQVLSLAEASMQVCPVEKAQKFVRDLIEIVYFERLSVIQLSAELAARLPSGERKKTLRAFINSVEDLRFEECGIRMTVIGRLCLAGRSDSDPMYARMQIALAVQGMTLEEIELVEMPATVTGSNIRLTANGFMLSPVPLGSKSWTDEHEKEEASSPVCPLDLEITEKSSLVSSEICSESTSISDVPPIEELCVILKVVDNSDYESDSESLAEFCRWHPDVFGYLVDGSLKLDDDVCDYHLESGELIYGFAEGVETTFYYSDIEGLRDDAPRSSSVMFDHKTKLRKKSPDNFCRRDVAPAAHNFRDVHKVRLHTHRNR